MVMGVNNEGRALTDALVIELDPVGIRVRHTMVLWTNEKVKVKSEG
jgi:hypothetical protein